MVSTGTRLVFGKGESREPAEWSSLPDAQIRMLGTWMSEGLTHREMWVTPILPGLLLCPVNVLISGLHCSPGVGPGSWLCSWGTEVNSPVVSEKVTSFQVLEMEA